MVQRIPAARRTARSHWLPPAPERPQTAPLKDRCWCGRAAWSSWRGTSAACDGLAGTAAATLSFRLHRRTTTEPPAGGASSCWSDRWSTRFPHTGPAPQEERTVAKDGEQKTVRRKGQNAEIKRRRSLGLPASYWSPGSLSLVPAVLSGPSAAWSTGQPDSTWCSPPCRPSTDTCTKIWHPTNMFMVKAEPSVSAVPAVGLSAWSQSLCAQMWGWQRLPVPGEGCSETSTPPGATPHWLTAQDWKGK